MNTIKYYIYISFSFTILTGSACCLNKPKKTNLPQKPNQEDLKKSSNPFIVISATGPGSRINIESYNREHTGDKTSRDWKKAIKLSKPTSDNQYITTHAGDSIKITANNGAEIHIHSNNIPNETTTDINNEEESNGKQSTEEEVTEEESNGKQSTEEEVTEEK